MSFLTRRVAVVGILSAPWVLTSRSNSVAQDNDGAAHNLQPSLIIEPGREFSTSSYIHKVLEDKEPIHKQSGVWVAELLSQITISPGGVSVNTSQYTPPIYIVPDGMPTVRVLAQRSNQPNWSYAPFQQQISSVPLPPSFKPSKGQDEEVIIYQPSTRRYWELWKCELTGRVIQNSNGEPTNEWRAGWGGHITDISKNPGYFVTPADGTLYGTAATGLPLLGGIMTIAELTKGEIDHPIHISLMRTLRGKWLFPAQRTDGRDDGQQFIPEGARFRLPADLEIAKLNLGSFARMIAVAAQKYGFIVRDKAGSVTLYGENPLTDSLSSNPYFRKAGIFNCPNGVRTWSCYPDSYNLLRNFPWDKLVVLDAKVGSE